MAFLLDFTVHGVQKNHGIRPLERIGLSVPNQRHDPISYVKMSIGVGTNVPEYSLTETPLAYSASNVLLVLLDNGWLESPLPISGLFYIRIPILRTGTFLRMAVMTVASVLGLVPIFRVAKLRDQLTSSISCFIYLPADMSDDLVLF